MSSAYLVLDDGRIFEGTSWAATGKTFGEAVFQTGMTGYQETLTDPSYHKQVVVMTAPHIGNTGVNDADNESAKIWVAGFVVRNPSSITSNWRAQNDLESELIAQGVVGIQGGAYLVRDVSTPETVVIPAIGKKKFTVAALDLGIKGATPRALAERGVEVHVMPFDSSAEAIMSIKPDGVFLSNGPGDPSTMTDVIEVVRELLLAEIPLFGICFGHQILGRALGFETYKLQFGHRGINQPVMDKNTGKVEITAHNHGFAVKAPTDVEFATVFGRGEVTHTCLNDGVVEGLQLLDRPAFSVQYHPEAAAGPHDAAYLFDRFVDLMSKKVLA